jgi:hypothetical protein
MTKILFRRKSAGRRRDLYTNLIAAKHQGTLDAASCKLRYLTM